MEEKKIKKNKIKETKVRYKKSKKIK